MKIYVYDYAFFKIHFFYMRKLYISILYLMKKFVVNFSCQAAASTPNSVKISNVFFRRMTFEYRDP